ncbi:hypothetical protein DAI22_11g072500 [Oryza sativa Japonica Group]|nr:hypothetical protein DAI22_11g072500 [Oryza sativa Japonica Group]
MLCKVNESDAAIAAAALVGIAKEARKLSYLLSEDDPDMCLKYDMCEYIRAYAAEVLTKLEKEFSCNTAGHAAENGITASDKSEKPIGYALTIMRDKLLEGKSLQTSELTKADENVFKLGSLAYRSAFEMGRIQVMES